MGDAKAAPCPECHYDLRGIDSEVCPECGAPIMYDRKESARRREDARDQAIGIAILVGILGGVLHFFGGLWSTHDDFGTALPLLVFFGPLLVWHVAIFIGFALYPIYVAIIHRSRRPGRAALLILIVHYLSAAGGIGLAPAYLSDFHFYPRYWIYVAGAPWAVAVCACFLLVHVIFFCFVRARSRSIRADYDPRAAK